MHDAKDLRLGKQGASKETHATTPYLKLAKLVVLQADHAKTLDQAPRHVEARVKQLSEEDHLRFTRACESLKYPREAQP